MSLRFAEKSNTAVSTNKAVGDTVENFSERMRRKLRDQQLAAAQHARVMAARHATLLHAINLVRKAIGEATKVDLGKRFSLDFDVSDWEGWPRLELSLVDRTGIDCELALVISANCRQDSNLLIFGLRTETVLARVDANTESDIASIPPTVKKVLRHFLDLVSERVLCPDPVTAAGCRKQPSPRASDVVLDDVITENHLARTDFDLDETQANENRVVGGDVIPIEL